MAESSTEDSVRHQTIRVRLAEIFQNRRIKFPFVADVYNTDSLTGQGIEVQEGELLWFLSRFSNDLPSEKGLVCCRWTDPQNVFEVKEDVDIYLTLRNYYVLARSRFASSTCSVGPIMDIHSLVNLTRPNEPIFAVPADSDTSKYSFLKNNKGTGWQGRILIHSKEEMTGYLATGVTRKFVIPSHFSQKFIFDERPKDWVTLQEYSCVNTFPARNVTFCDVCLDATHSLDHIILQEQSPFTIIGIASFNVTYISLHTNDQSFPPFQATQGIPDWFHFSVTPASTIPLDTADFKDFQKTKQVIQLLTATQFAELQQRINVSHEHPDSMLTTKQNYVIMDQTSMDHHSQSEGTDTRDKNKPPSHLSKDTQSTLRSNDDAFFHPEPSSQNETKIHDLDSNNNDSEDNFGHDYINVPKQENVQSFHTKHPEKLPEFGSKKPMTQTSSQNDELPQPKPRVRLTQQHSGKDFPSDSNDKTSYSRSHLASGHGVPSIAPETVIKPPPPTRRQDTILSNADSQRMCDSEPNIASASGYENIPPQLSPNGFDSPPPMPPKTKRYSKETMSLNQDVPSYEHEYARREQSVENSGSNIQKPLKSFEPSHLHSSQLQSTNSHWPADQLTIPPGGVSGIQHSTANPIIKNTVHVSGQNTDLNQINSNGHNIPAFKPKPNVLPTKPKPEKKRRPPVAVKPTTNVKNLKQQISLKLKASQEKSKNTSLGSGEKNNDQQATVPTNRRVPPTALPRKNPPNRPPPSLGQPAGSIPIVPIFPQTLPVKDSQPKPSSNIPLRPIRPAPTRPLPQPSPTTASNHSNLRRQQSNSSSEDGNDYQEIDDDANDYELLNESQSYRIPAGDILPPNLPPMDTHPLVTRGQRR